MYYGADPPPNTNTVILSIQFQPVTSLMRWLQMHMASEADSLAMSAG